MTVVVDGSALSYQDVVAVARNAAKVDVMPEVLERLAEARERVDELTVSDDPAYGVSTGFGALASRKIPQEDRVRLQHALVRSHAAGTGHQMKPDVVRAMMLLRLKTLCSGVTGIHPNTVSTLAKVINAGITPRVYEYGSLGCSGDLAPLSAAALVLIGEGEVVRDDGSVGAAADALAAAGIDPIPLGVKEGLSLINGTDGMLGMLAMTLHDLDYLLQIADLAAAMSIEAQLGSSKVFDADLMAMRPQVGQQISAARLRALLANSPLVASHQEHCDEVQDAYSLRCTPQVHGAALDTVAHAHRVARLEMASSIDNPALRPDGTLASHGNFHGAPVAAVLDFLAISVADVASIAERRTDRALDPARNRGLPAFLAKEPGLDSGLMIAQYTSASLVAECKRLAVPASVDSIPSSAMQEDHVSMGWAAGRKLRLAVRNLASVLAIEILCATRAIELRTAEPGPATGEVMRHVVRAAGPHGPDRHLSPQIEAVTELVWRRELLRDVEGAIGPLHPGLGHDDPSTTPPTN